MSIGVHVELGGINTLAREASPVEEYLAPTELVKMETSGKVDFLALLDNDTFSGFIVTLRQKEMAYLFSLRLLLHFVPRDTEAVRLKR